MATETITFYCSACGIRLTVPASLAGISGPCPSCSAQIQAPTPAAAQPSPSVMPAAPSAPATPVPQEQTPVPAAPVQTQLPPVNSPSQPVLPAESPQAPIALKPEPRKLPARSAPVELVAKPMPEPRPGGSHGGTAMPLPRHPKKSSFLARFLMPLLFLAAAALLIYGVHTVLTMEPETGKSVNSPTPPKSSPPSVEPSGQPETATTNPGIQALPTPEPEKPTLIEPPPELPDGVEARSPGMEALAVLESFLTAKSLEERLPLIETKTPLEELADSCLAAALPATTSALLEFQESDNIENLVDFYYTVDFENPGRGGNRQMILVRTRGGTEPKVVVDPFLDLFGGRLAAYAAEPSEKAGIFQVIIYAVATCLNQDVPDPEKKRSLKLLASDNSSKEIAMATFGKQSKIGEMLEDGTYAISYGKAKSCTVMLRWNTEDDPKHPYLEALTIKALGWNP